VGTYRSGEIEERGVADAIAAVARQPAATTLHLGGLSDEDVARLIEMTAGAAPRDSVVRTILEETEGNPLFVKEVVNLLAGTGRLGAVTDTTSRSLEIPQGVLGVLGRRVERLSPQCRELLEVAAVIGREFGLGVLERVSGDTSADALALVEEALAARVVADVPAALGRYSFSHALVRQILYSALPAMRRRELHRQVGETLESVYGASSERHLPELAYHFLEAAPAVDGAKAIGYAVRAAERATAQLAYEDAAVLYQRALELGELAALNDAGRIDLLLALAASLTRAGDTTRAKEVCSEAAALAREAGDPERLARAALEFAESAGTAMWTDYWVPDREPLDLLDEALARLPHEDAPPGMTALRAELLARMASELATDLDPAALAHRETISAEAVRLAHEAGDPLTLIRALAARHLAVWTPDNLDERLRLAADVVRLAREAGDRELELSGHAWLLCDHLEAGEVAAADRDIEAYGRLAAELREPRHLAQVTLFRSLRALFAGRFEECDRLANESAETARRVGDQRTALSAEALLFTLKYWQGALTDFESGLEAMLAVFPPGPASRSSVACAYLGIGRADDAKREYEQLATHDFADVPRDAFWLGTIARSAMVCGELKDERRGEILYEMLRPYADRNIVGGRDVEDCSGSAAAFAGLLAEMLGRADEAAGLYEQAIEMNERMGARLWLTITQLRYAGLLMGGGEAGRALAVATAATQTAQEVGAPMLVEWATGLRMAAQGVTPTDTMTSIDAVAAEVEAERPGVASHAAPDGTVTILFTDIEGSTMLTERLGDRRWLELLQEHNALIREHVRAQGGLEVKSRGDGFMLVFPSARQALSAAVGIQRAFAGRNASAPEPAIRVRIGLHTGEAVQEAGDFFGTHVNMAARIADLARGDEILISGLTRQLVAGFREFSFGEAREVQLKGLSSTHLVVGVEWASAAHA
jgi:class 3 adenylate cyclase